MSKFSEWSLKVNSEVLFQCSDRQWDSVVVKGAFYHRHATMQDTHFWLDTADQGAMSLGLKDTYVGSLSQTLGILSLPILCQGESSSKDDLESILGSYLWSWAQNTSFQSARKHYTSSTCYRTGGGKMAEILKKSKKCLPCSSPTNSVMSLMEEEIWLGSSR